MDELVVDREVGDISISLEWDSRDVPAMSGLAADVTQGRLRVAIRGQAIWYGESADVGFPWSWVELLEHLGSAWPYLLLEDGAPLHVRVDTAPRMLAAAEARVDDEDLTLAALERELIYGYQETHDLALAVQGAILPPLLVVRQGKDGWISTDDWFGFAPFGELLGVLVELGDQIAARLKDADDERARKAREQWANRQSLGRLDFIEAATGYPSELVAEADPLFLAEEERDWSHLEPDELTAAARSMGPVSMTVLAPVMGAIRRITKVETSLVDELAGSALGVVSGLGDSPAYEQGYALAQWLRSLDDVTSSGGEVDPASLLTSWSIPILEEPLGVSDIDAIGCWGPRFGPAIVLNSDGRHFGQMFGQRVTLAHEIAHILVDRKHALPLVEVLAGNSPEVVEVRARAFAAELLLPRKIAAELFLGATDFEQGLAELRSRFGVGSEIVAWQVKNSGQMVPDAAAFLRNYVSQPSRFR